MPGARSTWVFLVLGLAFWSAFFNGRRGQWEPWERSCIGAVIGASLGAIGGFWLPLVMAPESNAGPLLAFFTTPAFLLAGAAVGWVIRPRTKPWPE